MSSDMYKVDIWFLYLYYAGWPVQLWRDPVCCKHQGSALDITCEYNPHRGREFL